MLLVLLTALSLGAPTRELLDDIPRWEDGQDALLDGPAGCWDLQGDVKQVMTLHQPPDFFSSARNESFPMTGTIRGRLVDGIWTGELVQDVKADGHELELEVPVYPLFGSRPENEVKTDNQELSISIGDGSTKMSGSIGQSVNILREAVDAFSGSVETSLAQWDEEQKAVLLLREMPLSDNDNRRIEVTVRFPDGQATADRVDVVWPKLVKVGEWPFKVKLRDAQMHAVGHPHGDIMLPWAESLSLVAGAMGYTVGFEQTVTWRKATPCDVGPPAPEESAGEDG